MGPGGMYDAAAAGGMGVSPLPPGVYDPSTAFMGVPPVTDFVPMPGAAGGAPVVGSPLQQMPLPIPSLPAGMVPGMNGVAAAAPPVASEPIVEMPDPLEGLSLGGVDLVGGAGGWQLDWAGGGRVGGLLGLLCERRDGRHGL